MTPWKLCFAYQTAAQQQYRRLQEIGHDPETSRELRRLVALRDRLERLAVDDTARST